MEKKNLYKVQVFMKRIINPIYFYATYCLRLDRVFITLCENNVF